ncbi:hypothetical protein G6F31_016227 [Rhizopus arrhizus]|nr:hypothetical protein G6F31_016227 [Rhizopus arrhizus]
MMMRMAWPDDMPSAGIHAQAQHAAGERRQRHAELRQAEEPDEQLHQQRGAAKEQQIRAAQVVDDAALRVEPADADQQADDATQQQGAGGHLDGDHRAAQ